MGREVTRSRISSTGAIVAEAFNSTKLWRHQRAAVTFVAKYLAAVAESATVPAALLRLPTGAGKTGVMAVVVNYLDIGGKVLVIAPSEYLTKQIEDHFNTRFWSDSHIRPPQPPKLATIFVPTTLAGALAKKTEVFVCTTTTLQMLYEDSSRRGRKAWTDEYETLSKAVRLVIVDEGHREPAREWARAVRSLRQPTLLFSATPYRNDFRFFNIGSDKPFRFHFPVKSAIDEGIIRDVAFRYPAEPFGTNARAFARELRAFLATFEAETRPKVIVRCADEASIRDVMKALVSEGEPPKNVIGVHDRFGDEDDRFFSEVPRSHDAQFWVHQFKLTEGLDNYQFRVIAFFQPFGNARSLVQQVGRVLRNRNRVKGEEAFVFSDRADALEERWNGYLEFEAAGEDAVLSPAEIVRRYVASLPKRYYFDREYRRPARLAGGTNVTDDEQTTINEGLEKQIRLLRTAEVFRLPKAFDDDDLGLLVENSIDLYEDEDIETIVPRIVDEPMCHAFLNWKMGQSALLAEDGFFEIALMPAVFYRADGYLFHQGPVSLREVAADAELTPLEPRDLERLLGVNLSITQLSLTNCDLSRTSVRRRSIGARSVADIAPGLADHFHFVSSAAGLVPGVGAMNVRYVGFARSRISEEAGKRVALGSYRTWCDGIARQLNSKTLQPPQVLERFAQSIHPPANPRAKHILIDLYDFLAEFKARDEEAAVAAFYPERFEATAAEIDDHGAFSFNIRNEQIDDAKVNYERGAKRFVISSLKLNRKFTAISQKRARKSAAAFLSQKASVLIILEDGTLYADRHFYSPRVPLWGAGRVEALGILNKVEPLKAVLTEKGPVEDEEKGEKILIDGDTWRMDSIFGVIVRTDDMFRLAQWDPDFLICDDMGTEIADFIAVSSDPPKIALLHAKVAKGRTAAADFHVLNSQIVKNLELFNPGGTMLPARAARWSEKWQGQIHRIHMRKKKTKVGGKAAYELILTLLRSARTEREVWAVVGPGMGVGSYVTQLGRKLPKYPAIQLAYLLQSCNATVSSVGARFRLFAPP